MKKILPLIFGFTAMTFLTFSQTITWQKTSGPYGGTIGDVIVHPSNFTVYSLTGYNNNGGSIYRSSDNGSTWTEQKPAIFSDDLGQIRDIEMLSNGTILAAAPSNLYQSIDDGTTWTKINTGTSSSTNGFDQSMKVAKNNVSGTLYIAGYDYSGGNYKIFRSTNNGSTWTKSLTNNYYTQIVTTSNGDVYALASSQLVKSTDDGINFSAAIATPDASNVVSLTVKSDGTQIAVVTSSSNIYTLSSPSFAAWATPVETGITNPTYSSGAVIAYSPDNTTMFLLDNQNNKFYSRTSGSWTPLSTTFVTTGNENGISFAAKNNTNLYVSTDDIGVYKSINGGSGWIESNTGIESSRFNSIVVADDNSIINAGQRAYRSTDQGTSWIKIPEVVQSGYYAFKGTTGSPKPIVLIGSNGQACFRSTNSGSSWSAIAASPSANNYVSSDGTKIVGYNNTQFFFSSNQGTSWSAALTVTGTGWPTGGFSFYHVAMDQNSVIYAHLYDNSASTYKFFKIVPNNTTAPTTGAATQIPLATIGVTGVNAIGYLNNKVYVAGYTNSNDALCISPDAGVTWSSITLNNIFRIDADPLNNYLFATRSNGGNSYTVNLSRDGGSTFSTSTITGGSKSTVYGYALNSSGVAYAGVSNSSIFTSTTTIVIPSAPTLLVSSGVGKDRVNLRWVDNATNESRFVIEKFNGTSYDSIANESSNFTTGAKVYKEITNLLPNTSYTFRVYAKNSAGSSAPVSTTLSTLAQCAATIPDNRSWNGNVSRVPAGTSTLTNINIKAKGNGQYSITDVVNGTIPGQSGTVYPEIFVESCLSTYLIPDYPLEPNLNGTWNSGTNTLVLKWITANGITPETTGTVTLTLNAADPVPAAPTNATAYVYNNTGIEISWIGSAFETEYIIERSKDNFVANIDRTFNVNYPSTSVVDNVGLVNATTYYYRVKAKNAAGTSVAASNTATILFTKPYFVLSGTTVESTASYSTLGAIWGDFNNDGFDDLIMPQLTIFTGITTIPMAFKNDGASNFISVTPIGIVAASYLAGTAADYDNDGKLDLFLTATGTQNYLYKGNGDFTFSLVASTPVSENSGTNFFDLGASWVDYDKNGLIDLYVLTNADSKNAKLFTQGPVNTFTKETTGALIPVLADAGASIWADYDNDGDQDVFVTDQNNSAANQLYKNNGNSTFTRVTGAPFDTDLDQRSFTAAWGDYNNDTFLDLFSGAEPNNLLYKNNGNGTFTKQSFPVTVTETSTDPIGAAWGDVNNDGYLDLVVSNQSGENQFYINNIGTSFTKINSEKLNDIKVGNFGAAFSDYNNDGYLDLAVSIIDPSFQSASGPTQRNQLFKNNFLSGNWSEIKLIGVTSNKMAVGARITLISGGKTQIREVASTTSFCGQASQKAHFGIGANTSIASIQVKWPSGIIQTYSNPPINQILTISEDGAPPQVVTLNPDNNATIVAVDTKIEITFDEVPIAVAGKKITITPTGGTAIVLDVSAGVIAGNKVTFMLAAALAAFTQHSVTLDAGAFVDGYSNATVAISSWSFQTIDTTPPIILFATPTTAPTAVDKGFASNKLSFTITDNSGTVSSATLSYRKIAGGTFTDLTGIFNTTSGKWDFTVLETFFDATGLEYFITAKDPSNTAGRLPLDVNTNFYLYLNYKGTDNIFPSDKIGFGGQKGNWKIMSIPFELGANNGVLAVFDELNAPLKNKIDWRILAYKDASAWGEFPEDFSTFTRGKGYFINIKKAISTINLPEATAPTNTRKNLFQMALKKGWNQIGNPYLTTISWDDAKTFNNLAGTAAQLKQFESGAYTNNNLLAPFAGGFVFVDNDVTVSIPFAGQTASGGRKQDEVIADRDNWILPLTLTQDGLKNDFGGVGMQSTAQLSFDQFDDINPPRFFDFAEVNFDHPEHFAKHFARDIVPILSEYAWEFTINSNQNGLAELTWAEPAGGEARGQLFLLDVARQTPIDMRLSHSYSFDPQASGKFTIYYGENLEDKIKPNRVTLGQPVPNPTGGSTSISFTLPEYPGKYRVSLEIFDMLGRKIATVTEGEYASGFYKKQWNNTEGLADGLYTYRLTVAAGKKREVLGARVILRR